MKVVIRASSSLAEEFASLHDSANYQKYMDTFAKIYDILDKYATSEDENVDITFDKASKSDKEKLMKLVKSMHGIHVPDNEEDEEIEYDDIYSKYRDLCRRSNKLSSYESGYLDAMNDVIREFDLDFEGYEGERK